jgi:hypothetical protein
LVDIKKDENRDAKTNKAKGKEAVPLANKKEKVWTVEGRLDGVGLGRGRQH